MGTELEHILEKTKEYSGLALGYAGALEKEAKEIIGSVGFSPVYHNLWWTKHYIEKICDLFKDQSVHVVKD